MLNSIYLLSRSLVLGLLFVYSSQSAEAALVTYQFSGTVTDISGSLYTLGGHGANGFETGLKLAGNYTFDTTTPSTSVTSTNHMMPFAVPTTVTSHVGAITALNMSVGTYAPSAVGYNHFNVVTGGTANYQIHHGIEGNLVNGMAPSVFSIFLADATGTAFSNVTLPNTPAPDLHRFPVRSWQLGFANGDSVRGSLDSLQPVPLPSSFLLFVTGMTALIVFGMRRRFN